MFLFLDREVPKEMTNDSVSLSSVFLVGSFIGSSYQKVKKLSRDTDYNEILSRDADYSVDIVPRVENIFGEWNPRRQVFSCPSLPLHFFSIVNLVMTRPRSTQGAP